MPSKTRIEQDSEKARALAKKWATLAGRISRDADEVLSTLGTSFRDPYGYQLREIFLQTQLAQEGSLKTSLAADCMTEYARKLEQAAKTIKDRASRKRVLRTNWEVLIWCHLQATVGKELSRRYLPALIECADQAFGSERLPDKSFRGIIQNCERYKAESPTAYARHNNRALKNAALGRYLTPEHIFSAFRVPRAAKCWQREQLLCRNKAAEILGISESLLDHLIATERLLPVRIGKRVLLSWSGLRRFANGLVEDGDPEAAAQDALA